MIFLLQRCARIALVLNLSLAPSLMAGEPTDQVQTTIDSVLAVLKESPGAELNRKDRREQLRGLIYSRFDFLEMAKRALGTHWKSLNADEQSEFAGVFSGLLAAASTSVIDSYGSAKIRYKREVQEAGYSRVETKIVTKKGDEIAVDYNLHLVDGEWKVYDVVIENISMVNNYRSQFSRVIAESSFKELERKIKEKQSRISTTNRGGADKLALRARNIRDDSTPLILVALMGSSNDGQLIPRP